MVGLVSSVLVVGLPGVAATDRWPIVNLELSTIWNAGGHIPPVVSGDLVWVPVSEAASGSTDLNGDGDSDDWVAHVCDPLTGVTSLGLAVVPDQGWRSAPGALAIDDGFVFTADESAQGVDLNGDGDSEDWVAHIHTRSTGVVNLEVAAVYYPDTFYGDGSRVALPVVESKQGGTDLNGDGDSDDRVIHIWSARQGLKNTHTAMCPGSAPIVPFAGGFAFAGGEDQTNCVMAVYEPGTGVKSLDLPVSTELWQRAAAGAGGFAFLVRESANLIETDLNGDGDYGDEVIHFYRTGSGVVNLELAAEWVSPGGGTVPFGVGESRQAATDLNGDGDDSDEVVHIYDSDGGVTNLGVSSYFGGVTAMADGYGILSYEGWEGMTDLNGDGDTRDWAVCIYDPDSGLTNLGLAVDTLWRYGVRLYSGDSWLAAPVSEESHGDTDLNGDGDLWDLILHVATLDGAVTDLEVSARKGVSPLVPFGDGFVFVVSEGKSASTGFNGDGDFWDGVAHVYDPDDGLVNLGLAADPDMLASSGSTVAIAVEEREQDDTDLNGDGDTDDLVVHVLLPKGSPLPTTTTTTTTSAGTAAGPFVVDATADAVDVNPGNGICATSVGSCTLRAAIQESNALAESDTIELPAGTYVLSVAGSAEDAAASGDLDITDHLTISGAGDAVTVIDAAGLDRVIEILGTATTVELDGVTVSGGSNVGILSEGVLTVGWSTVSNNFSDGGAGGILNLGGSLTVSDSLVIENDVGMGGAGILSSGGPLIVERTTVVDNGSCAPTGGIRSWNGEALIVDSYVAFNNGDPCGDAGGITNGGSGVMAILGTTVEGNHGGNGGGVENAGAEMSIINSTISGNTSDQFGGGVYGRDGSVFLINTTVADNTAPIGGGLYKKLGTFVEVSNTILSGNTAADGPDCFGTVKSLDYNLFGDLADCTLTGTTTHNLAGVDPLLGALADNGGPTDTRALLPGSPAIDAGPTTCDSPDQRGVTRPQGAACDIGAFEVVPPPPEPPEPEPPEPEPPEPEPVTFVDDDDSIFEADIEWIAARGITKGCNPPANTVYCPNSYVTRGQMAAFLVRALGYTDNGGGNLFIDDDDSIFESDIDRLGTAGVTKGCNPPSNNRYCPNGKVTRGQMAAFLVRALGYTDGGGGILFVDDNDSIFEGDIDRLGTAGVTKGCDPPTNNRCCPTGYVTRGQMAAFLHRALG